MKKVLSTKILTDQQKAMLDSDVSLSEYDAIKVAHVPFSIQGHIKNAIFTSKNAVSAVGQKEEMSPLPWERNRVRAFCVGDKTEAVLRSFGFNVIERAQNAQGLAQRIIAQYADQTFTFFCGNLKRKELPHLLKEHHIPLDEVVVYETFFNKQHLQNTYDALLFFSPSAVQSFTTFNEITDEQVYCIGPTTAEEAKKHTDNIHVAHRPTIEHTIKLLINNMSFRA